MIVKVTKEDILDGICGNPVHCPVAIAVRRATKNAGVSVTGQRIQVGRKRITTPRSVHEFVEKFDFGFSVKPFNFRLTL